MKHGIGECRCVTVICAMLRDCKNRVINLKELVKRELSTKNSMEYQVNRRVISATRTPNYDMGFIDHRARECQKKHKAMMQLINELHRKTFLLEQVEEEVSKSSGSDEERVKDEIKKLIGSCYIGNNVSSVSNFIWNADA